MYSAGVARPYFPSVAQSGNCSSISSNRFSRIHRPLVVRDKYPVEFPVEWRNAATLDPGRKESGRTFIAWFLSLHLFSFFFFFVTYFISFSFVPSLSCRCENTVQNSTILESFDTRVSRFLNRRTLLERDGEILQRLQLISIRLHLSWRTCDEVNFFNRAIVTRGGFLVLKPSSSMSDLSSQRDSNDTAPLRGERREIL